MASNSAAAGGNGAERNGAARKRCGACGAGRGLQQAETGDGSKMKKDGRGYFFCGCLPGEGRRQQGEGGTPYEGEGGAHR